MSRTDYRGTTVPDPDDPLLPGLIVAFATAGVITRAASVAAARLAVDNAVLAGATVSASRPMYFNIGGIFYQHDGATLRPFNEVEVVEQTARPPDVFSGTWTAIINSSLPARPYDRVVRADAIAFGKATGTGGAATTAPANCAADLVARIGTDDTWARFDQYGDDVSVSCVNTGIVRAGDTPAISLGVSVKKGTLRLSTEARLNRLVVTAFPITMAG